MDFDEFCARVADDRATAQAKAAKAVREGNPHPKDCKCEDCYFETFGREIEKNPIGAQRAVRDMMREDD